MPIVLAPLAKVNAVLLETHAMQGKAAREKINLTRPMRMAATRGSKLIPALSRNGAV